MKSKTKSPKGLVEIDPGELDLKNAKVKTTLYLDGDLWDRLNTMAEESGAKYQALTNKLLREIVFGEKDPLEERLRKIEAVVFKQDEAG